MQAAGKAKTYRVRQLPCILAYKRQVASFLASLVPGLDVDDVRVLSLAASLTPLEIPPTKVATVMFEHVPSTFNDGKESWTIAGRDAGLLKDVLIDVHFEAVTPLNEVEQGDHEFDCIAVSGLASHPFGSWKERGSTTTFMWLRDRLPRDLPNVRSIIYGYDTALLHSESVKDIDDIAKAFIERLKGIGRASRSAKPLVILAHSLGGIVVKQALLLMARAGGSSASILDGIRGVMLFGVPNQGMKISHLLPMVEHRPNSHLVEILSTGSPLLAELDESFSGIMAHRPVTIVSVYETKRSATTRQTRSGEWRRDGPFELLVDKESAIQRNSHAVIPVDQDHSNMVKFGEADQDCQAIIHRLKNMATRPVRSQSPSSENLRPHMGKHHPPRGGSETTDEASNIRDMLRSLQLRETGLRRDDIKTPFKSTFQWIFEDEDLGFVAWLASDAPVYWISGKPGSGKSTLMKFACGHHDTRTAFRSQKLPVEWGSTQPIHIIVDFFFHDRGTAIQKSLEGLLYSILFSVLSRVNKCALMVLPLFMNRPVEQRAFWSLHDLRKALEILMSQKTVTLRVLIFLDALDEFDGEPAALVDFVQSLTRPNEGSCTQFKICCSSRQWNAFQDAFADAPGCKIHEHTRGDIRSYINGRFLSNPRMKEMMAVDVKISQLKYELAVRAEGVFVWVSLVVNDLLQACTDGARADEMLDILTAFPVELGDSYQRAIERVPMRYREETYVAIEVLLRSERQVGLRNLGLALICATAPSAADAVRRLPSDPYSEDFLRSTKRRLQSRCGGMLQFLDDTRVEFMHQTVKEFFGAPGSTQSILSEDSIFRRQNGFSFLTKFHLTLASATRRTFDWPSYILCEAFRGPESRPHYLAKHAVLMRNVDYYHHDADKLFEQFLNAGLHPSRASVSRYLFLEKVGFVPTYAVDCIMRTALLSEITTGWHQGHFLNQLDKETWSVFSVVEEVRDPTARWYSDPIGYKYITVHSPQEFAQRAGLRLYLVEWHEENGRKWEHWTPRHGW